MKKLLFMSLCAVATVYGGGAPNFATPSDILSQTANQNQGDIPTVTANTTSDKAPPFIPSLDLTLFDPTVNANALDIPALAIAKDAKAPTLKSVVGEKKYKISASAKSDAKLYFAVVAADSGVPTTANVKNGVDANGKSALSSGSKDAKAGEKVLFDVSSLQSGVAYRYVVAAVAASGTETVIANKKFAIGSYVDAGENPAKPSQNTSFTWKVTKGAWNMLSIPNGLKAKESAVSSSRYVVKVYLFDENQGFQELSKYSTNDLDAKTGLFVYVSSDSGGEITVNSSEGSLYKTSDAKSFWQGLNVNKWHLMGVPNVMEWANPTDKTVLSRLEGCSTFGMYQYDPTSSEWNKALKLNAATSAWLIHRCAK